MHQHPRPAPRSASAASNLQTNPTRTNNQRDELTAPRALSSQSVSSESGSAKSHLSDVGKPEDATSTQNPERQRLNLIVQVSSDMKLCTILDAKLIAALLFKGRSYHNFLKSALTTSAYKRRGRPP